MRRRLTMAPSPAVRRREAGSSLIEALVSVLLLSFGVLSLSLMMSFAVQMPKLSAYRATAMNLASSHVERIRSNPAGFSKSGYDLPSSYDGSRVAIATTSSDLCNYPSCDANTLATMDFAQARTSVREQLPAGGIFMLRDSSSGVASATEGNLWILWQEPDTRAAINPASADNCPADVAHAYPDPKPRCLYVRFRI